MEVKYLGELENIIRKYGLYRDDICIAASAVLAYEDIRENNDLDIVIRPEAHARLLEKYGDQIEVLPSGAINLSENVQAAYNRYQKVGIKDEELFCEEYVVCRERFKVVKPEVEIAQKIIRNKEKDRLDLESIRYSFFERSDFDMDMFEKLVSTEENTKKDMRKVKVEWEKETAFRMEGIFVMPVGALLHRGYSAEGYNRYDILLLAYALSHWKENIWNGIVKQIMDDRKILLAERNLKNGKRRYFEEVIVKENGIPEFGTIELGKAVCRHDDCVKIEVREGVEDKEFGLNRIYEYNEDLALKIEKYKEKVFREYGVYFCAIIWGAAIEYAENICEKICEKFKVSDQKHLVFEEKEYCSFIKEIYDMDEMDYWKTAIKIEHLRKYSHSAEVIIFEIPFPNFREKWRDGSYLSGEGAKLKREIREEFKKYIPDYKKDVIIHIGDNHRHNALMMKVVEKYWERKF